MKTQNLFTSVTTKSDNVVSHVGEHLTARFSGNMAFSK